MGTDSIPKLGHRQNNCASEEYTSVDHHLLQTPMSSLPQDPLRTTAVLIESDEQPSLRKADVNYLLDL